jgi:hypothetical protein
LCAQEASCGGQPGPHAWVAQQPDDNKLPADVVEKKLGERFVPHAHMIEPSVPSLPPLAHEVMGHVVPGFRKAIEAAALRLRRGGWTGSEVLDPKAFLDRAGIDGYLVPLGHQLIEAGGDRDAVVDELDLLGIHTFYALSYEMHRRKTFWIDESLAFMLAHTRLDVRGEGLRLPFASFALMFTDRATLAIGEALANRDDSSNVRGLTLRSLTVYVTRIPADDGALGLQLSFLLDANNDNWPWILTRDLVVRPDDVLDEIIESHFPDAQNADPVFASAEVRQLVELVLNAILFATSSPSWPVVASPLRAAERRRSRRDPEKQARAARRAEALRKDHTGEDVWHLPGKIPISQVRALRELQGGSDGGALFARSMVRGHWRRAPETWRDRSPRWIEPYWKGPELGAIVEREYRMKP